MNPLVLAALLVAGRLPASDWPTYRGDYARSGISADPLPERLDEAWVWRSVHPPRPAWQGEAKWDGWNKVFDMKARQVFDRAFHAVIADGRVYFGSSADDKVYCLDARTGRELWSFYTEGPVRLAPTVQGGHVYFGSDDGCVYCLEAADGKVVWQVRATPQDRRLPGNGRIISAWPVRTSVVVQDGLVYTTAGMFPSEGVHLIALDARTGAERWRQIQTDLPAQGYLLASRTRLYVPAGRDNPAVCDLSNGKRLRVVEGAGGTYALLTGDMLVFGPGKTGQLGAVEDGQADQLATFQGNHMIVTATRSYLHADTELSALDRARYLEQARERKALTKRQGEVVRKLRQLEKTGTEAEREQLKTELAGLGAQIDARTQAMENCLAWKIPCRWPYSVVLAGDTLAVGGASEVAGFRASDGQPLWTQPVQGNAYGIAAADGALLVSTGAGTIHCLRGIDDRARPHTAIGAPVSDPASPKLQPERAGSEIGAPPWPVASSGFAIPAQREPGLLAHWRFSPDRQQGDELKAVSGGPNIPIQGNVHFTADPGPPRVELSGRAEDLVVAEDLAKVILPKRELTAEAWVRVDRATPWGGIFGVIQDNGEYERGWLLGFVDANFSFAVASENAKRLTYLKSSTRFETNRWYHVVGTYDGAAQCLYVNGALAASATEQSGTILYPPRAPVMIGAYRDDDEHYRLQGALHEVRLFQRALGADEIRERFRRRSGEFPEPAPPPKSLRLAYGPFVDWRDRNSAVVTWETDHAMPTRLELEVPAEGSVPYGESTPGIRHEIVLTGLKPDCEYYYRILGPAEDGIARQSKRYLFDTSFYYSPLPVPPGAASGLDGDARFAKLAKQLLDESGVRDGYCFVLGAGDGRLALELVRQSRLQVVVVDADPARLATVRRTLDRGGVYGVRASAHLAAGPALPYSDLFVNLIVSESVLGTGEPPEVSAQEAFRLLRPLGGTLLLGRSAEGFATAGPREHWDRWLADGPLSSVAAANQDGRWIRFTRDRLVGAGEWSHQYGSPDNSSSSQDELVQGDLQVAWWGDPGPRPMPDRGNRNPAPLSVNGRLFIQGNRVLFGLDAYNGTILWTVSAPEVRRANVTRDCSNMAAAGERLYVAHGRSCLAVDGQTGARGRRFAVVEDTPEAGYDWGYVAAFNDGLIGSRQKRDATYLGDDGEWYEDFSPDQTSRVTSDRLFSYDPVTGELRWTYHGGVILNSTITIADGMILFLESRNPVAAAAPTSRLSHELLTDQHLVALDLRTGKPLWEKGHDFSACQYMTYLVYGQGTAVVTGTDKDKNYHTFAFSAPSPGRPSGDDLETAIPGRLLWSDDHQEDKGHHSGHLQHPLVIDQVYYSDQRAFDLRSGKLVRTDLPERRGCGVMSASRHAVFFRHYFQGMWDLTTNKRSQFEGIRTGCWLGLIPAGGMLLAPESSAGCSCTHAIQTSVGYLPKSLTKR